MRVFETLLADVSDDAYFVDLRGPLPRDVASVLAPGQVVRSGGTLTQCARMRLADAMDGFVFFPRLSPGRYVEPPS